MIDIAFGLFFALLTLLAAGLQRTYYHYPLKELKRRARGGDHLAGLLYRPVSYGVSLRVLLWLITLLSAAAAFVLLARGLEPWLAFAAIVFLIWLGFLWLPSARLNGFNRRLAAWLSPSVAWLLNYLHPLLQKAGLFLRRHSHFSFRTDLYEKEDLFDLLERQKKQPDNRIPLAEIDLLQHVLSFGDRLVADAMVPRRSVVLVNAAENLGPVVLDELHKSGHSRFPVYKDEPDNVVGTLYMRDLMRHKNAVQVEAVMRPDVFYIHEDFGLDAALNAFIKTKHHLFIVVNSFEEFVGILTIEDIIEQIIGKTIVDEFDRYDDIRAVAAAFAASEHEARKKADSEVAEVVE